MVLPLYDHSPFKWPTPPYVTWLLIAANVAVFVLQMIVETENIDQFAALVPAAFSAEEIAGPALPAPLTLISYSFLHANLGHIFGNMIFLWVFGDDVEEVLGHARFVIFYLACAAGSGAAFVLSDPGSRVAMIGASGAVAGVLAAYLMFRPCAKVTVLLFVIPVRVSSFWVIGGWAAWQCYEVISRAQDGIAYWAHVGGLATGAILFAVMRPPGVALFECTRAEFAPAGSRDQPQR